MSSPMELADSAVAVKQFGNGISAIELLKEGRGDASSSQAAGAAVGSGSSDVMNKFPKTAIEDSLKGCRSDQLAHGSGATAQRQSTDNTLNELPKSKALKSEGTLQSNQSHQSVLSTGLQEWTELSKSNTKSGTAADHMSYAKEIQSSGRASEGGKESAPLTKPEGTNPERANRSVGQPDAGAPATAPSKEAEPTEKQLDKDGPAKNQ